MRFKLNKHNELNWYDLYDTALGVRFFVNTTPLWNELKFVCHFKYAATINSNGTIVSQNTITSHTTDMDNFLLVITPHSGWVFGINRRCF